MNTREAGWYDDPQDSNVLRYWDGVTWTEHTSPRQKPGLGQAAAGQGQAQGYGQSGQGYGQPGQYAAPGSQPQYGQQQPGQYGQAPQQGDQQGQYQYGQQAGGWGQPMPGGAYTGTMSGPSTPDGQPLGSWGMRLLARIIDSILVAVVALFVTTAVVAPDLMNNYMDLLENPPADSLTMPATVAADLLKLGLVAGVLGLIYEALMLKTFSATLGKMATGLRVRLRDQDGPLSWATAGIRALVWQGPSLLSGVQALSFFTAVFNLLNGLWPLWDKKKQSLNDKFAKTNVVKKRP